MHSHQFKLIAQTLSWIHDSTSFTSRSIPCCLIDSSNFWCLSCAFEIISAYLKLSKNSQKSNKWILLLSLKNDIRLATEGIVNELFQFPHSKHSHKKPKNEGYYWCICRGIKNTEWQQSHNKHNNYTYKLSISDCLSVIVSAFGILDKRSCEALFESIRFKHDAGTNPWRSSASTFHQSFGIICELLFHVP